MLAPLLVLAALTGAWELYVEVGGIDELVLPAPHTVAQALYDDRGLLWSNFGITAQEVGLGVLLALAAVVIAGQILGRLVRLVGQPPVIGEVLAGILLGPSLLGAWMLWRSRSRDMRVNPVAVG